MLTTGSRLLGRLFRRPAAAGWPLAAPALRAAAPALRVSLGAVEELSALHVAGWIADPADPGARVAYEVVCRRTGRVLAQGVADQYRHSLNWRNIGDAAHGFHTRLPVPDGGMVHDIEVRPAGGAALPVSPGCRPTFEPLLHVAMDIVDNCNLRCPFCLYDYANTRTTNLMTKETLASALRLLPFVRDGNFWFSCLHEPTLHPELMAFIDSVPREYRRKLFYTTNLAKRMPDSYFDWLAQSGLFNINVSIESRDPAIYERMRKGARHRIFQENWEKLLAAFARAAAPPKLRYISMAYKSNLAELPGLARYLLEERQAWQVEMRYTYDAPYIPDDFRTSEFLEDADWAWLRQALPSYPTDRLLLIAPPPDSVPDAPPATGPVMKDYYFISMSYDGSIRLRGVSADSRHGHAPEPLLLTTNIHDIADPQAFFDDLP